MGRRRRSICTAIRTRYAVKFSIYWLLNALFIAAAVWHWTTVQLFFPPFALLFFLMERIMRLDRNSTLSRVEKNCLTRASPRLTRTVAHIYSVCVKLFTALEELQPILFFFLLRFCKTVRALRVGCCSAAHTHTAHKALLIGLCDTYFSIQLLSVYRKRQKKSLRVHTHTHTLFRGVQYSSRSRPWASTEKETRHQVKNNKKKSFFLE